MKVKKGMASSVSFRITSSTRPGKVCKSGQESEISFE